MLHRRVFVPASSTLVTKLRATMGKRAREYVLAGRIELDEGYFSTETYETEKDKPLKRGRGSQRKTKVLVMAESEIVENPVSGKNPRRVIYLKMKVIDDLKKKLSTARFKRLQVMFRR
jgi:hypothetical protein